VDQRSLAYPRVAKQANAGKLDEITCFSFFQLNTLATKQPSPLYRPVSIGLSVVSIRQWQ